MPEKNISDELNAALVENTKQFILGKLDDETIRQYLVQLTAERFHEIIESYKLKNEIESVVTRQVQEKIPQVVNEVLSQDDIKEELTNLIAEAVHGGIVEGAKRLRDRLSEAISKKVTY